jgi:glycosyltransferase involved in cell wall biosynthesis
MQKLRIFFILCLSKIAAKLPNVLENWIPIFEESINYNKADAIWKKVFLLMTENELVCHISFNHSPFDDRIYWKELLSLKQAGYNCVHIAVDTEDSNTISPEGITIITVQRSRLTQNIFLNKMLQAICKKSGTINKIWKIASNLNAAVYHYHDLQINIIAKDLRKLPHRPKVIYDAHEAYHLLMLENMSTNFFKKALYKVYVRMVTKWELKHAANCDYIILTDKHTLNYFRKNLPGVKCDIVYNYSYFRPSEIKADDQKVYTFIYTGHISKGRGIKEAIDLTAVIKRELPNIKFLIIGSFENELYKEQISKYLNDLGLIKNVVLKPNVPFEQISNYYSQSAIGIGLFHDTPKYSSFIPIKLFEYMAFGLPVVFSDHGPSADIVREENCGILVDYANIEETAKSVFQLLSDEMLFNRLSENGKNAVLKKYNWDNEKSNLLLVYQTLNIGKRK